MSEFTDQNATEKSVPTAEKSVPTVIVVIGMAGAGKTTLMHRMNLHMQESGKRGYYLNLDPAVRDVPFGANIDIRDTVNYKEVMKQYGLGPNGSILTSLNLFATRFDQVVGILEKRSSELDYIFVDTPGQIESFTWSAGGQIILELLATAFPTLIMYVTDTPRSSSPTTFMSNMLYASSVLYKSQLPMVCVFNKTDVCPCAFALEWMRDFEAYQAALDADGSGNGGEGEGEGYMSSLNRSLSLAMDEFYRCALFDRVGVRVALPDSSPLMMPCAFTQQHPGGGRVGGHRRRRGAAVRGLRRGCSGVQRGVPAGADQVRCSALSHDNISQGDASHH